MLQQLKHARCSEQRVNLTFKGIFIRAIYIVINIVLDMQL